MERGAVLFALNHMAAPKLELAEFFSLAKMLGISRVEIRPPANTNPDAMAATYIGEAAERLAK
jgi:predicted xylose isomerase-like sugar epimerase